MTRPATEGGCAGLCSPDGIADAYREHRAALLTRARCTLRDRGLAEEAVQETFLRAWRACASFDPADGPPRRAWLRAILRNIVVDMVRARAVRPRLPHLAAGAPDSPTVPGDVDRLLLRTQLVDALGELSPVHRRVVVDAVIRGRPQREVAAALGVPTGTVKSRLHYALRHLRAVLDPAELSAS